MAIAQITIIGTGLIGGSLALALKHKGFAGKIVGCDHEPVLAKALGLKAIDGAVADPLPACAGSDVVVLATPVSAIIDLLERLLPELPPRVLVTDTGSTKSEITARAQAALEGGEGEAVRFLGGHPMAGKEHSGIEQASATLFENAVWFITPLAGQDGASQTQGIGAEWVAMIRGIGARVVQIDANNHDRLCAWASHLPQMMSTALASCLVDFAEKFEAESGQVPPLHLAGGRALREMTRIASSPYSVWRDIALTNTENIEDALLCLEQELAHIRENLKSPELREQFKRANSLDLGS